MMYSSHQAVLATELPTPAEATVHLTMHELCHPLGVQWQFSLTFCQTVNCEKLQVQVVENASAALEGCSYELRGAQGRRLRRWPRRSALSYALRNPAKNLWPVLEPHRWLWDD
jgi:hypothetical protein